VSDQARRQLVSGSRIALLSLVVAMAALIVAIATLVTALSSRRSETAHEEAPFGEK
jgi:hypothetical protein